MKTAENTKIKQFLIFPCLNLFKTFFGRSFDGRLNRSSNNGIKQSHIGHHDRKIAELEQEFQALTTARPRDIARSCEIISELGRLWNTKLCNEPKDESVERGRAKDLVQLQKAVSEIICEGKEKMASAQSQDEIHAAFIEGVDKIIYMLHDG